MRREELTARALLMAVSLLFTAGGAWMVTEGERYGWWIAAFFGVCFATFVWQGWMLRRAPAAEHPSAQG